ncbi:MAG: YggS family pyridoxal phosphate-dependent enzyme [Parvularculaceae bacterium]|nr:YggS family pyridoxal phosphate-dependent enzyme [Parvularculaceae bacterium]
MTTPPEEPIDPVARLAEASARLKAAAREAGRESDVAIVVAAKTQTAETLTPLLAAGHRLFGENRVQEAQAKWPPLKARFPDIRLSLIGPLQSNKARDAVALFDEIASLDRIKLAAALAAEMAAQNRRPDLLVQVNTGEEPQKAGVAPQDLPAFLAACRAEYGLSIAGLLCIPPADEPPAPHFALLAKLAARHGLARLSMGMSGDYEIAAQLGATEVRLGSSLFGPRG